MRREAVRVCRDYHATDTERFVEPHNRIVPRGEFFWEKGELEEEHNRQLCGLPEPQPTYGNCYQCNRAGPVDAVCKSGCTERVGQNDATKTPGNGRVPHDPFYPTDDDSDELKPAVYSVMVGPDNRIINAERWAWAFCHDHPEPDRVLKNRVWDPQIPPAALKLKRKYWLWRQYLQLVEERQEAEAERKRKREVDEGN